MSLLKTVQPKLPTLQTLKGVPLRVFSMEELGRLGTACRENAIMVGRDSFFDLSTAYLKRHVSDV